MKVQAISFGNYTTNQVSKKNNLQAVNFGRMKASTKEGLKTMGRVSLLYGLLIGVAVLRGHYNVTLHRAMDRSLEETVEMNKEIPKPVPTKKIEILKQVDSPEGQE